MNGDYYRVLNACRTKHDIEFDYLYVFREQDYLDSKAK
jgi:hypothetical protein